MKIKIKFKSGNKTDKFSANKSSLKFVSQNIFYRFWIESLKIVIFKFGVEKARPKTGGSRVRPRLFRAQANRERNDSNFYFQISGLISGYHVIFLSMYKEFY